MTATDAAGASPSSSGTNTRGGSKLAKEGNTKRSKIILNGGVQAEAETVAEKKPIEIFREDYAAPSNWVTEIDMEFDLRENRTTVTSCLTVSRNPNASNGDLVLDGDEKFVSLMQLDIGDTPLQADVDYEILPGKMIVKEAALYNKSGTDRPVIKTVVELVPEKNTALNGLYKSGGVYCTQCEAMGFRRITYFPDRPDNMSKFNKVRIEADKDKYPVLLSNGNKLEEGAVPTEIGRHYCVWSDPFPKPSYLFCIVAGNLGSIKDKYKTMNGRIVDLRIFSEPENVDKLDWAMKALKKSMKWDEDTFALEYDLDLFNIVAVNDFNMGAMENKGLNVFNSACVLADAKTATDANFARVEGIIAHEYFHNWTGNRVTCRDWFQLTLKEGLTVFRDQSFSGDMMGPSGKAVKRIEDVRTVRGRQFAEDAGPMSHPIRPNSYISMDNFYTATVYRKGAEVIRMYQTLLTPQGFRKGMDLYFKRHDGNAVTCDDFRAAMADANDYDLTQFALWYETPGTPIVKYSYKYDADAKKLTLELSQSSKASADAPLHIPVATGLLDLSTGKEVVATKVLDLKENIQTFEFEGLECEVVPSILRDFSAPVKLVPVSGEEDESLLSFLAAYDTDGFNKWEAGQKLFTSCIMKIMDGKGYSQTEANVFEAYGNTLKDTTMDPAIKAYTLIIPSESELAEDLDVIDPPAIRDARKQLHKSIARKFETELKAAYDELTEQMHDYKDFSVEAPARGQRSLRNTLLSYLCRISDTPEEQTAAAALAMAQYKAAKGNCLTDQMAALSCVVSMSGAAETARDEAIQDFYKQAKDNALVLDKWFTAQALADLPDVLDRVKALSKHPDFTLKNPNRCRSLVAAFTMNEASFHAEDGSGYQFLSNILADLDKINPQISSRLSNALLGGHRYNEMRSSLMKAELQKLANMKPISDDLFEKVTKGLNFKKK